MRNQTGCHQHSRNRKLTVVPDIHLHAQPQHLNIEGKTDTIPRANIDIEQLPESAITVSNDEVI